jgi:hypothetical protein
MKEILLIDNQKLCVSENGKLRIIAVLAEPVDKFIADMEAAWSVSFFLRDRPIVEAKK